MVGSLKTNLSYLVSRNKLNYNLNICYISIWTVIFTYKIEFILKIPKHLDFSFVQPKQFDAFKINLQLDQPYYSIV